MATFDPFGYFSVLARLNQISTQLGAIETSLNALENKMSDISDAVADLTAKAGEIASTEDAALVVLNGLRDQLTAALANAADAATAVANVRQVIAGMDTHNAPLAAAIATPPTP